MKKYAKFVVKDVYGKRGDLVLRSYIRALKKIYPLSKYLLDGDEAYIYGIIDDDGLFHEVFTKEVIQYDKYVLVNEQEIILATICSQEERELFEKIMKKVLFNQDIELGFSISTRQDLAFDRKVESIAYDHFLSRIDPYSVCNNVVVDDSNNFVRKIEELKNMEKNDSVTLDEDAYEVKEFQRRPFSEQTDFDYLVFQLPKGNVKILK